MQLNINSSFLLSLRMICLIKFSVFYGNGRKELCKDDDYPIKLRLKLKIIIAKLFVIESSEVEERY